MLVLWSQSTDKYKGQDFAGGPGVKNPPATAEDSHSAPGLGRSHMQRGNRAPTTTEACMPRAGTPPQEKPPQ